MIRTLITISLFLFSFSFESRTAAQNTHMAKKPGSNPDQWALLIGVSDYPGAIQDLRFPGADARSIKDLLTSSAGFADDHVRLLTDDGVGEARATKQNIFSAIDQYLAPRVQPGHEIIIFLAGHGVVRGVGAEARSYYLPVDTDAQTKEALERTAIDLEELSGKLSALKASQFTVFYDACREDPFPGRGLKGNALTDVTARLLTLVSTRMPQPRTETPTGVIFYACQIGERAYENTQLQHGVFTYYILRGLRELADRPDGRVEAGRLAGYLSENVRKWTREQAKLPIEQNPTMVATDVRGPVLIARVLPVSAIVPEPPPVAGILLNTFPEGATISIDGKQAGRGPLQKELPPNQYTVRAELAGFQPSETKVNVIAGYRQEITINLQASGGNSNYEKGVQFERQQLWPQAIASYQQALREDPNSSSIYERLAQTYVKNGRYREAVELLTVAAQKFPDNALILARRSRAQSAIRSGEDDLAASFEQPPMSQSFATQSDEGTGEKSKKGKKSDATKKSKKKKDEEAGEQLPTSQSLAPQPDEESGKKSKKSKKSKKKKDEEAGEAPPASQSLTPQPDEESDKKNEKEIEEAQTGDAAQSGKDGKDGKKSKGGKKSKKSKKSKKESSEENQGEDNQGEEIQARSLIGAAPVEAQEKSGGSATGVSDAIRDAELAIQKDDRLAEAHLALGFALLAEGKDYDRALAAFVRASTIAPEDAEAYFGVGYAYRLKQQCQQAAPQLKKAIELRPDYYEAQRELAYCYHTMGATDQAIRQYVVATSYRAAARDSSELAANNLALAALYRKKGDEIGGAEGEEYKKTGKACEDDAREQEPSLKGAAKRLAAAGVLQFVGEKSSPDIRKVLDDFNLPKGAKAPVNIKTPIGVNVPINIKTPIGVKLPIKTKSSKGDKNKTPSIGVGTPTRIPIKPKASKGDKAPTTTRPTVPPRPKPTPQPTPKPIIRRQIN
ncbi:MAG TPA: caspase family protein [Blastocatellia bacterium]|jgi:tetratricopeptide (TPR) repeat protein|nr:caspase family protein [Blastocatellia bacterium]